MNLLYYFPVSQISYLTCETVKRNFCYSLFPAHPPSGPEQSHSLCSPAQQPSNTYGKKKVKVGLPSVSFAYFLEIESVFVGSGCFLSATNQLKLA